MLNYLAVHYTSAQQTPHKIREKAAVACPRIWQLKFIAILQLSMATCEAEKITHFIVSMCFLQKEI